MRLFIAIDTSKEVDSYLFSFQTFFPGFVNSFHITLKFLGESDPNEIIPKLRAIEFETFELELSSLGAFPSAVKPRVIWAGVTPQSKLIQLQKKVDDALPGYLDEFMFHPHITLARPGASKFHFEEKPLLPLKFKVLNFKLYKSTITSVGPIYEVIEKYDLKDFQ